jgi:phospholipase C
MNYWPFSAITRASALCLSLTALPWPASAQTQLQAAQAHIQHVIIIVQENRSFDHYFGTYPGANGIPVDASGTPTTCYPQATGGCLYPFHDGHNQNGASTHSAPASIADIGTTKAKTWPMKGFLLNQQNNYADSCLSNPAPWCAAAKRNDAIGYHNRSDLPNYWAYADHFMLQDAMFAPAAAWSGPTHLYDVSAWSATCTDPEDPLSCTGTINLPLDFMNNAHFAWSQLVDLMDRARVSWKYYIAEGKAPDCDDGEADCPPQSIGPTTRNYWNPLPGFQEVQDNDAATGGAYTASHIQKIDQYYLDTTNCALPVVSWFVPDDPVSEHPPADITAGMQYVTGLVNAIMNSPCGYWNNTVIFLTWDDWGGFFDHVVPPVSDLGANGQRMGYGIRVPGLILSPWVKPGVIDHQTMSFDAYQRFIEDLFLNGARIGGFGGQRPDSRPVIRENLTTVSTQTSPTAFNGPSIRVGNLLNDFNFSQSPLPPLILPTNIPNDFFATLKIGTNPTTFTYTFPLTWSPPANVTVTGYNVYRTTTIGSNYQPVQGCATAFGQPFTGTSCTDTSVTPGRTYFYAVTAIVNGVESPRAGHAEITP